MDDVIVTRARRPGLVCGMGTNDAQHPTVVNGKVIKTYTAWRHMLTRCYSAWYMRLIRHMLAAQFVKSG